MKASVCGKTVSKLEELTEASVPIMEKIEGAIQSMLCCNADDLFFSLQSRKNTWLRLLEHRSQKCSALQLGVFSGILTTGCYSGYRYC